MRVFQTGGWPATVQLSVASRTMSSNPICSFEDDRIRRLNTSFPLVVSASVQACERLTSRATATAAGTKPGLTAPHTLLGSSQDEPWRGGFALTRSLVALLTLYTKRATCS